MSRAIVLFVCLASAAGVAAYTHYSSREPADQVAVFTVPKRVDAPAAAATVPPTGGTGGAHVDKAALARQLQRELRRVGCYSGEITGVWTTSSRVAMKAFVDRVNSKLPIDSPDPILLSLVQGHRGSACDLGCPAGEAPGEAGCTAAAMPVKSDGAPPPTDGGKGSALPAAAAAGALAATAAATGGDPKSSAPDRRAGLPGAAPEPRPPADAEAERPPTRKEATARERRQRRSSWKDPVKPPRVVRDFLRSVERTFGLR